MRKRLVIDAPAQRPKTFFDETIELMRILARSCGCDVLNKFNQDDLTTFKRDIAELIGIFCGGV